MGVATVYGMRYGMQGLLEGRIVDLALLNPQQVEQLKRTPSSYLGSCRTKLPRPGDDPAAYARLFAFLMEKDIGAVLYIGGQRLHGRYQQAERIRRRDQ